MMQSVLIALVAALLLVVVFALRQRGRLASLRRRLETRDIDFAALRAEFDDEISRRDALEPVRRDLEQARRTAENAVVARGQFLANMSHEIRTPMNGVLGMLGLLRSTHLSPIQDDYAETAEQAAETLLDILDDILDLSKMEAGKLTVEPIPFDLRVTVEDVAGQLATRAEEKGLELIVRFAPLTPRCVIGDPGRLRQILVNLVGNAIKFTEQGHVLIDVECRERNIDRAVLRLAVEDTGIGVPEDKLEQIFEEFAQADTSTTRRFGGTGLGLTISRQLVELMGGRLGVKSVPGEGSTFWIALELPFDPNADQPCPPPARIADLRVLVVDDNATNRRVLYEQLSAAGVACRMASAAREALEMLLRARAAGEPFQLAVIDFMMPEMDGQQLAEAIQADPRISGLPMVLLTSVGNRGDADRFAEIGYAGYLVKPVRPAQLLEAVALIWGARQKGRDAPLITRHLLTERRRLEEEDHTAPMPIQGRTLVLVAEDNAVNQKVATKLLESLGCRVELVDNGEDAVRRACGEHFDLILMDGQMPRMGGVEATAEIRRREARLGARRVPIVAMTAHALRDDRRRYLDAGMDDYLAKPFSRDDLASMVTKWTRDAADLGSDVPDPSSRQVQG